MKNYYEEGYRDGHLDRLLGLPLSIIASTYPDYNLPDYSRGYIDGYNSAKG